jgi:hypothetical protein
MARCATAREARMRAMATLGAAILLALTCGGADVATQPPPGAAAPCQRAAARAVVGAFGRRLRLVATLAPKAIAAEAMGKAHAGLVAPELLAAWKASPETAPGKRTSSPSPERIDITAIRAGRRACVVSGTLILLTAQERREGGVFQANPVTITVAQQHGQWLITAYEEEERPPKA